LEIGSDVNTRDNEGQTPIMYPHTLSVYQLLIDHHADLNAQDNEGKTALIRLSEFRWDKHEDHAIRLLLQHGAKVSIKDKEGKTALDHARSASPQQDYKEIIPMLEEALRKEKIQKVPK